MVLELTERLLGSKFRPRTPSFCSSARTCTVLADGLCVRTDPANDSRWLQRDADFCEKREIICEARLHGMSDKLGTVK